MLADLDMGIGSVRDTEMKRRHVFNDRPFCTYKVTLTFNLLGDHGDRAPWLGWGGMFHQPEELPKSTQLRSRTDGHPVHMSYP